MIDAHFHRRVFDTFMEGEGRAVRFLGVHPWQVDADFAVADAALATMAAKLAEDGKLAVGEIGLDRLHRPDAAAFARQREIFEKQLELAARFSRPVVLHGAKCWGEVVKCCLPYKGIIPSFLFHGFSRSAGLIGDIVRLNGFISVGPAVVNEHAVNYRAMVAELPPDRVLVETDLADDDSALEREAVLSGVYEEFALLRGLSVPELAAEITANASRFIV